MPLTIHINKIFMCKNVLFPAETVASKICVPSIFSFDPPGPSTQQPDNNLLQVAHEVEQNEPSTIASSHEKKTRTAAFKRTIIRRDKTHKRFFRYTVFTAYIRRRRHCRYFRIVGCTALTRSLKRGRVRAYSRVKTGKV